MDIIEVIKSRRTIHRYTNKVVPEELVNQALSLALMAPNHKNTQPWRFVKIGKTTKSSILDIQLKLKKNLNLEKASRLKEMYTGDLQLIILGCLRDEDSKVARENYASVVCGVQNISLYLWSQKVGCKWSTGVVTESPELYNLMGWDPLEIEIVGLLWLGEALVIPPVPKRVRLDNVLKVLD